jgi:biopolymer transport protein ExbD
VAAMYTAQQVRSKQRFAIKRREEQIEQEEIEGGEINLIPYLDIVTNLMLFLLASVSAGIILGQINTTLPDRAPPSTSTTPPDQNPADQPLKMVVSITKDKIILWSVSGLEGTIAAPKATFPRIGKDGEKCDGSYMCESNKCDSATQKCVRSNERPQWVFDYRALNKALFDIANQRYSNKTRKKDSYQSILMPDSAAPYGSIVSVMTALRCRMPEVGKPSEPCMLPTDDERLKKATNPIDTVGFLYDTDRAAYDPNKMALFHDIVFSPGVE